MQIRTYHKGTTLIVVLSGELDHHATDALKKKVDAEMIKSSTKDILFDFSRVSFMDSSGIGAIAGRYKNIQSLHGKVAVVHLNPHIKRIFEMSGFLKIIPAYETIDHALEKIRE